MQANLDPKVSIIIPFRDNPEYLLECLDSLAQQTYDNLEVIVVDDGSQPNVSSEIRKHKYFSNNRFLYFYQPNQGAGVARNLGFKEAHGEYVLFLDSDDYLDKKCIEQAIREMVDHNPDVFILRGLGFYDDSKESTFPIKWAINEKTVPSKEVFSLTDFKGNIFEAFVWWPWDKLIKRSLLLDNRIFFQDLRTTNDLLAVFCSTFFAKKISISKEFLVYHRISKNSLSVTRQKSWTNFIQALIALKLFLEREGKYKEYERDFLNYVMNFTLWQFLSLPRASIYKVWRRQLPFVEEIFNIRKKSRDYYYSQENYEKYLLISENPRNFRNFLKLCKKNSNVIKIILKR